MFNLKIIEASVFEDDFLFKKEYEELSPYRKAKIDAKTLRTDKNLSLAASVLLKDLLKSDFQLDEKQLEYRENEAGKPYIVGLDTVFFNISHSKNIATCVVSDKEIGIDIEIIRPINLNIAQRFFTGNELNFLLNIDDNEEKMKRFFRIWTLKEAYTKCIGATLASQIQQFDTLLHSPLYDFDGFTQLIFCNNERRSKSDNVFVSWLCQKT
ncbi:MAG: 4'-phosphopantetheinyl transferase superfamily protein [Bacteroidales bacterium]|jgi:4'-phosphopantetheinyl transferase|nr:4'-phosphopantetheinyl transferase superfamily protein [Bacteroidales bacterium]